MMWILLPVQMLGGGVLGGIIVLVVLMWVLEGLFRWAAGYWGAISLVLGSAAIILVGIRSIINYKKNGVSFFGNIKAHGPAFSILWLLGTLALLLAGNFVKELAVTGSQALQFNFGLVFCVIGIIAGALTGGKLGEDEGEGDGAGEGALFGALGFAILFVVFFIALAIHGFMSNTGADDINRAFIGIFGLIVGPILGAIGGAIIGAVIGAILGAIGGAIDIGVGGKLIGGLLGIISGGGLGILLSVFVYSMLRSSNGTLGAAGLTLAASFGLFNKFSPEDNDTLGEGRIACLVTLLIAALSVGIVSGLS
jgi:hypothetical protein